LIRENKIHILSTAMKNESVNGETQPDRLRILIVEDHEIVRRGILDLFEKVPDMEVVGEAADGETAVRMAREMTPDMVIMDVMLPGLSGIEATRIIRSIVPLTRIVTLSLHSDREYVIGMLKAGAMGYLLKDCEFSELIDAIRVVRKGRYFLGQSLIRTLSKDMLNIVAEAGGGYNGILTQSEQDVMDRLIAGEKTDEIASELSVTREAIERECHNIINKWLILFC
jgi:DNA-binding NarL/FixJ family response regulator